MGQKWLRQVIQPIRHEVWLGKKIGIVLINGQADPYDSGAVNAIHSRQSMFRYLGVEIGGRVYGSAPDIGDAAKHPKLME